MTLFLICKARKRERKRGITSLTLCTFSLINKQKKNKNKKKLLGRIKITIFWVSRVSHFGNNSDNCVPRIILNKEPAVMSESSVIHFPRRPSPRILSMELE